MKKKWRPLFAFVLFLPIVGACATLGGLGIQPPSIEAADGRQGEIRMIGPSSRHLLGGVQLRLFARISNPNPMALTLTRMAGTLSLEGTRAADVDFPLGVPLPAAGDTIVPIDIEVGFSNLPALARIVPDAISGGSVAYGLDGNFTVDAGILGQPSFGPMTMLRGEIRTR